MPLQDQTFEICLDKNFEAPFRKLSQSYGSKYKSCLDKDFIDKLENCYQNIVFSYSKAQQKPLNSHFMKKTGVL